MKILFIVFFLSLSQGIKLKSSSQLVQKLLFAQMNTILESANPLSQVYFMLDDLTEEIRKEQQDHDSQISQQNMQCGQELAYRQREVTLAKFHYSKADSENDNCESALSLTNIRIMGNSKDQAFVKQELGRARGTRGFEEQIFRNKTAGVKELLNIIDSSLASLEEASAEPKTLLELPEIAEKLLLTSAANDLVSHIAPTILSFVQIAENSKSDVPSELLAQKLHELRISSQESGNILNKLEAEASDNFEDLINRLTSELQRLEEESRLMQKNLGDIKNCVESQQNIMFQASDKDFRDSGILKTIQRLCQDWKDQHESQSKLRAEEMMLIESMREISGTRFGGEVKGLGEKSKMYEQEWENYKNELLELRESI